MLDKKNWEDTILEKTIKSYYEECDQSELQKSNFNNFIHHRLHKIIEEESLIEVKINENEFFRVCFDNIYVDKPYVIDENRDLRYITPMEARFRELNYSGCIFSNIKTCNVIKDKEGNDIETNPKIYLKKLITKIPIMIQSSKCNLYGKTKEERVY